ncbi:MAG: PAS domain S-box protein [Acidobacteriales bacterium]|nr:PAS domain S-box protein [Terriglobales bacterium]
MKSPRKRAAGRVHKKGVRRVPRPVPAKTAFSEPSGRFLLDRLLQTAFHAVAVRDEAGTVLRVNEGFEHLFGYTAKEVVGRVLDHLIVPPGADPERSLLVTPALHGIPVDVETVRKRKDGTVLEVSILVGGPSPAKNGKKEIYTVYRDISARKSAEAALRDSENKFRALADNSATAIYIHDGKHFLYVNPAGCRLVGYTLQEMMAISDVWKVMAPEDRAVGKQRVSDRVSGRLGPSRNEYKALRKDGSVIWVDLSAASFEYGGKTGIVGSAIDITERKNAEAEREKLIAELQAALAQVKTLSGLLPICANCKKIRDEKGEWAQIESYIHRHSDATFTHGICPECAQRLYPEEYKKPSGR